MENVSSLIEKEEIITEIKGDKKLKTIEKEREYAIMIQQLKMENSNLKNALDNIADKSKKTIKILRSNGNSEMYNQFKNVVKNTVELECKHIQEDRWQELEESEEYKELETRCSEIYEILRDKLSKELYELLVEFDEKKTLLMCLTEEYYFKQGVVSGLTNLKFLEVYGNGIIAL